MTAMRMTTIAVGIVTSVGLVARAMAGDVAIEVGDAISLEVEEVSLREVLVEIGETVPLTLVERGVALEEPVSLTLEGETWPDLLGRLIGRESYLLTFDGDTGKPTRLVVLWDAVRERRAAGPANDAVDGIEARIRALASEVLAAPDVAGEAIASMEDARDAFERARGGPREAAARAAYVESIRTLGDHDEARTVGSLLPAFDHDDRDARLATLETMRWLSHTRRSPAAVDAALGSFETADDPEVERSALEVLVRYGDPRKVMRLLEPLALSDGPNRDLAVREWIRIKDEQAEQEKIAREGDPQLRALQQ